MRARLQVSLRQSRRTPWGRVDPRRSLRSMRVGGSLLLRYFASWFQVSPDVFCSDGCRYKSRKASRFCVGDAVFVTDTASSCYGVRILAALVNKREGTPDEYDVVFDDGRSEILHGLDRFNRCLSKPAVFETSRERKEETETKHGRAQGTTQAGRGDTADAVVRDKGECP